MSVIKLLNEDVYYWKNHYCTLIIKLILFDNLVILNEQLLFNYLVKLNT